MTKRCKHSECALDADHETGHDELGPWVLSGEGYDLRDPTILAAPKRSVWRLRDDHAVLGGHWVVTGRFQVRNSIDSTAPCMDTVQVRQVETRATFRFDLTIFLSLFWPIALKPKAWGPQPI